MCLDLLINLFFCILPFFQVRKLILEMIQRLPTSDFVRPYVKQILSLCLKLLQTDNEENVLVCLRIIIDMHKQYRPAYSPDSEVILILFCKIQF